MRIAALLVVGACSGPEIETPTGDSTPPPPVDRAEAILGLSGDLVAGEDVFLRLCQFCHGSDGLGTAKGPDLTERLVALEQADVIAVLLDGKGNMDAYDSQSDQDLADVSTYVLDAFKP